MKFSRWQLAMATLLILLSGLLYYLHYFIFRDAHHIFIYLLGDIAFLPIEVLLVTLILHELLSLREKRSRQEKLKMVIGVFFSGLGTELIELFSSLDPESHNIKSQLSVTDNWTDKDFSRVSKELRHHHYHINLKGLNLPRLKESLNARREFLLGLLENPNLAEHEEFTNLLLAVFHLYEEVQARPHLNGLPQSDQKHLENDIRRIYILLAHQWLEYMKHLQASYPFLFSLALRTNPFNDAASPIITDAA